ncbi:MAG: sigma-54-dependent Fis family transcriptional regulator [Nitrosomonadales bacterium SCN 54-20]|nr:MAG: sigma-54-dependent Fis family transcriptional regulator [Nitrosomonadales bacterium SCN 54-20]
MARILIVDDDIDFREGLAETVHDLGHIAYETGSCRTGLDALEQSQFDLIILDHRLGDTNGLEFLQRMRELKQRIPPVIMLTAFATAAGTVEAIKLGAFDHLLKPVGRNDLARAIERALRSGKGADIAAPLKVAIEPGEVIGNSAPMREVLKLIGLASSTNVTVLLTGETGSGKEVLARLLHGASMRAKAPFIAVNCAAIPAELLESELFGHVKGSFTGAVADRAGRFRQARGGTLLLDEIGDMPLTMQAKVLRVIEDKRFTPVGSAQEESADVRLVAATHRDLGEWVRDGHFREDLYHRLRVLPIRVPSLRERPEDIPALASHFLAHFSHSEKHLSDDALDLLRAYTWPGNVRELRNLIERACVTVRGTIIAESDVSTLLNPSKAIDISTADLLQLPLPEAISGLERIMIQQALRESRNNRAEAARRLGIHRQLLYAKLKEYGLD